MKVALLTSYLDPARAGGVGSAVIALADALQRSTTVECRIVGLAALGDGDAPLADVRRVMGPRSFGYAPGLIRALDRANPDLVHAHGLWTYPSLVARRWSRRTGKPRIVSPHGMLDTWALRRSTGKKRLALLAFEDANLRGAACLHAVSEAEAEAIRHFGLRNPIAVVPNMADPPPMEPTPMPAWRARLPPAAHVMLFLGRLHPKKGLAELVEGWRGVGEARRTGWHLAIAGWDEVDIQGKLETAARKLGIGDTVHFIGPQTGAAKAATFAHSDAFILPSHSEGMPVAVLEAWAHGLPVIMTRACNLPAGIAAGAALPTSIEPAGIARALAELIALDDDGRQRMGAAGRQLVLDRFSHRRVATTMSDVYHWVVGAAACPACVDTW